MADEDRELLRRYCRHGEQEAFAQFYRHEADRLWRFLRTRGADPEAAYDLVADAFLRFLENVCRDPGHPRALLYRIAINLSIDRHRRQRIAPEQPDPANAAEEVPAPGAPDDEREAVRRLVASLPEREQNLLLLRYWIGLTHREIAGVLEQPEGTVRRQCSEALAALREAWTADGDDPARA